MPAKLQIKLGKWASLCSYDVPWIVVKHKFYCSSKSVGTILKHKCEQTITDMSVLLETGHFSCQVCAQQATQMLLPL